MSLLESIQQILDIFSLFNRSFRFFYGEKSTLKRQLLSNFLVFTEKGTNIFRGKK